MFNKLSTIKKLIWLFRLTGGGGTPSERSTITGTSPLSLLSALAKPIKSLVQHGKCTVSGSDITCNNGVLSVVDGEIVVTGTPEEIVVSASGADDQTATAENLFAVDTIYDTQDIITGKVTRRCEPIISDGTTPSGRYIGTVGEGNILVRVKETGYTGAIASFEADKEEPLNGLVCEMNPVQDLHGYDNPWPAGGGANKFDVGTQASDYHNTGVINSISGAIVTLNIYGSGGTVTYRNQNLTITGQVNISWTASKTYSRAFVRLRKLNDSGWMTDSDATITGMVYNSYYMGWYWGTGTTAMNISIEIPSCLYWNLGIGYGNNEAVAGTTETISNIMLVTGSTAPSAYSPYENICPISGHTGVDVEQSGRNFVDDTLRPNTNEVLLSKGTWYAQAFLLNVSDPSTTNTRLQYKDGDNWINILSTGDYGTFSCSGGLFGWLYANATMTLTVKSPTYFRFETPGMDGKRRLTLSNENLQSFISFDAYNSYQIVFPALGKNLLDTSAFTSTSYGGVDYTKQSDGSIKIYGTIESAASIYIVNNISLTLPAGTYTLLGTGMVDVYAYLLPGFVGGTFTLTEETTFTALQIRQNTVGVSVDLTYYPQINTGSAALPYEPYNDTVYGGTLDVVSGKLVADIVSVDLGTLDWSKTSSTQGIAMMVAYPNGITTGLIGVNSLACSAYSAIPCINAGIASDTMFPNNSVCQSVAGTSIRVRDDSYTDATTFKAAMQGVQLCYELATPITYQLDPVTVQTLLGQNNIWHDANGDTTAYVEGGTTEERVAPQRLSTSEGDNTITVTAEVSNIVFDVTYVKEKDEADVLQSLNILLGGAYRNNFTPDDVSDGEALNILMGR